MYIYIQHLSLHTHTHTHTHTHSSLGNIQVSMIFVLLLLLLLVEVYTVHHLVIRTCIICSCYSVPSFMNEWYWHRLMTGTQAYVEFHNRVYGCSGVEPQKYPCTGPNFT